MLRPAIGRDYLDAFAFHRFLKLKVAPEDQALPGNHLSWLKYNSITAQNEFYRPLQLAVCFTSELLRSGHFNVRHNPLIVN